MGLALAVLAACFAATASGGAAAASASGPFSPETPRRLHVVSALLSQAPQGPATVQQQLDYEHIAPLAT
jgi:hypothetical protein